MPDSKTIKTMVASAGPFSEGGQAGVQRKRLVSPAELWVGSQPHGHVGAVGDAAGAQAGGSAAGCLQAAR